VQGFGDKCVLRCGRIGRVPFETGQIPSEAERMAFLGSLGSVRQWGLRGTANGNTRPSAWRRPRPAYTKESFGFDAACRIPTTDFESRAMPACFIGAKFPVNRSSNHVGSESCEIKIALRSIVIDPRRTEPRWRRRQHAANPFTENVRFGCVALTANHELLNRTRPRDTIRAAHTLGFENVAKTMSRAV